MLGEAHDVARAIAKRENMQLDAAQPEQKIGEKSTLFDQCTEVFRGGRDGSREDDSLLGISQPANFPRVQKAEKFGLQAGRCFVDLVEEERPPIGLLQETELVVCGTGERASQVPEKLALEKSLRERRAIDHRARFAGAACSVDRPREKLLPRSSLA